MNAISKAFNDCSLFVFIDLSYKVFIKKEMVPLKLTVIGSCTAHVMKFFCNKLVPIVRTQKKVVSLVFAKCTMANSYNEFLDMFALLYLLLKSENIKISLLMEATRYNSSNFGDLNMDDIIDEDYSNDEQVVEGFDKDFDHESSMYMHAPFMTDIQERIKLKFDESSGNFVPNSCFLESAATYLLRKLGPFCCLQS